MKLKINKTSEVQEGFISFEDSCSMPDPEICFLYKDKEGLFWTLSNGVLYRQDGFGGIIKKKL